MVLRTVSLSLIAVALVGCVSISDEAASVQFHTQVSSALDGCERVGPLTVRVSQFSLSTGSEISVALREAAASIGADTVVALNYDETISEIIQQGIAYKCY